MTNDTRRQTTDVPINRLESIHPAEQVTAVLGSPIDQRHLRSRKQGKATLDYFPWAVLTKCLHHRVPGWQWELLDISTVGSFVMVRGRLSIPCGDAFLHYDAVSSEPLETDGYAPPIETAASSCLRRACALAGLGLELWLDH